MAKAKAKTKTTAAKEAKTKGVGIDQRKADRRKKNDATEVAKAGGERRKVQRRRQIDPTTCERDYSNDEIEFMRALDEYKRANGRMFPTCSEILEVVRGLGYERRDVTADPASAEADSDQPTDLVAGGTEDVDAIDFELEEPAEF